MHINKITRLYPTADNLICQYFLHFIADTATRYAFLPTKKETPGNEYANTIQIFLI